MRYCHADFKYRSFVENDLEFISEGQTRRQRCQRLLTMLPTRGPQAYGSFTHALKEDGYVHISDRLTVAPSQSRLATSELEKNSSASETKREANSKLTL